MRIQTVIFALSVSLTPAGASPTVENLHRRASDIIVPACEKVNNGTDNFGHHVNNLISKNALLISDVIDEMSKATDDLVRISNEGVRAIGRGQKDVTEREIVQVLSLREVHHSKVLSIMRFMIQGPIDDEFPSDGRGQIIVEMLKKQKDANRRFSTQVMIKMPQDLNQRLQRFHNSTEDALNRGVLWFGGSGQKEGYSKKQNPNPKNSGKISSEKLDPLSPYSGSSFNSHADGYFDCKDGICEWIWCSGAACEAMQSSCGGKDSCDFLPI
jgi:hypothetical protein